MFQATFLPNVYSKGRQFIYYRHGKGKISGFERFRPVPALPSGKGRLEAKWSFCERAVGSVQ